MTASTALMMANGVRVVVPDVLSCITTYVLCEQGDWFEDEIKFLRRLLQPGQRVIDIGANYGVYALSAAKLVGPAGRVWAFEPASGTARHLAEGIAVNGFSQLTLIQSALSDKTGTARLSLKVSAELNELVRDHQPEGNAETVSLTTLDESREAHGWRDIAFVKLDAEGEEVNILRGGSRFLAEESPLIQYEIRAGVDLNLTLVRHFERLGYASYRLVPGLDVLVPFDQDRDLDRYTLNLFCCKPDRAAQLAEAGFLVDAEFAKLTADAEIHAALAGLRRDQGSAWLTAMTELPHGRVCAEVWQRALAAGLDGELESGLAFYALSRRADLPAKLRFAALGLGFTSLMSSSQAQPRPSRLASLARVAVDYGSRAAAITALNQLCTEVVAAGPLDADEPFLAPYERFDAIVPKDSLKKWLAAASLEALEKYNAYSSIFTGPAAWKRLDLIHKLGYGGKEMNRRWSMVKNLYNIPD
jgi:FkbM family methyltransferase